MKIGRSQSGVSCIHSHNNQWLIISDFTKQYNRLRQHVAVRTGNAQGVTSSINHAAVVAPLPAVNKPRAAVRADARDKTADQLAALVKYSSRIAKIDQPYVMGASVNRKGPSSYANAKDKSDRATSEQVLDPRTRIILFKMIGRELIQEVNGCVSTGKEVNLSFLSRRLCLQECLGKCLSCTHPYLHTPCAQNIQDIDSCVQGPRSLCDRRVSLQTWL